MTFPSGGLHIGASSGRNNWVYRVLLRFFWPGSTFQRAVMPGSGIACILEKPCAALSITPGVGSAVSIGATMEIPSAVRETRRPPRLLAAAAASAGRCGRMHVIMTSVRHAMSLTTWLVAVEVLPRAMLLVPLRARVMVLWHVLCGDPPWRQPRILLDVGDGLCSIRALARPLHLPGLELDHLLHKLLVFLLHDIRPVPRVLQLRPEILTSRVQLRRQPFAVLPRNSELILGNL